MATSLTSADVRKLKRVICAGTTTADATTVPSCAVNAGVTNRARRAVRITGLYSLFIPSSCLAGRLDLDICAHAPEQAFRLVVEFDGHLEDHIPTKRGGNTVHIDYLTGEFLAQCFDEYTCRLSDL